jgi:hypothetical protein
MPGVGNVSPVEGIGDMRGMAFQPKALNKIISQQHSKESTSNHVRAMSTTLPTPTERIEQLIYLSASAHIISFEV